MNLVFDLFREDKNDRSSAVNDYHYTENTVMDHEVLELWTTWTPSLPFLILDLVLQTHRRRDDERN